MQKKPLPTQAELSKILSYNAATGCLTWRGCGEKSLAWNRQFAGKEAFTYVNSRGYKCGGLGGTNYKAHRVIWKLVHGDEPDSIDHIDGDALNNRLENLRSVSHTENMRNQKKHSTNKSGYSGVHWSTEERLWLATIRTNGVMTYLGSYLSAKEAGEVRGQFERRFGFHPNHGKRT